jgi:hypothetical protein
VGSAGSGGATGSPWQEKQKLMEEYELREIEPRVLETHPPAWRRFLTRRSCQD